MPDSPYFLINADKLKEQFSLLSAAMRAHWDNFIIGYSYKTNSLPWIIRTVDALGAYAEVVSDDEYSLAKRIGAKGIIYNGIAKSEATFLQAVNDGDTVNIDSWREIEWMEKNSITGASVGIRVNFDIEKLCPGESACGSEGGRFGFCCENCEFEKAVKKINYGGNRVVGLHLHTSSKTRSTAVYRAIAKTACRLAEQYDLNLGYVDIGGGFFGGMEGKPTFDDYFTIIAEELKKSFSPGKTMLIAEPGMSLIGPVVSFVTSVTDVKQTLRNRFVVTDGSRCQIDPLMRKTSYFYRTEYAALPEKTIGKQVICGYTCMENDRIMTLENAGELREGDKIIYDKTGAYTMCLSPLFIKYFPAVYAVEDGKTVCVRARRTCENYLSGEEE